MSEQVIIAGKGIAGLVLSSQLDKHGIDHVLLFRKEGQSPISLGETIPPSAMPLLHNTGLFELFEQTAYSKTSGYHSIWGSDLVIDHHFYQESPTAHGFKINKAALIEQLTELQQHRLQEVKSFKEVSLGASVQVNAVTHQGELEMSGRMMVDATGKKRAVLKLLNVPVKVRDQQIAFSTHLPGKYFEQLPYGVFMESFMCGWGIVSALDEETNVMTLYTAAGQADHTLYRDFESWPQLLKNTKGLKYYLPDAQAGNPSKIIGYDASTVLAERVAGQQWLAIGDAAMSFDPLSSHGITNAIWTANRAASLIKDAVQNNTAPDYNDYQRQIHELFTGYAKVRTQLYQQKHEWEQSLLMRDC